MLVWLTEWQVAEDLTVIRAGDVVDWTLVEADRAWLSRLFAERVRVDWQLDTYADATEQPSRRVRGHVLDVRSVRCRQITTNEGRVPRPGAATLTVVDDTSGSWKREPNAAAEETGHGHSYSTFGYYGEAVENDAHEHLYGYLVTVRLGDDGVAG